MSEFYTMKSTPREAADLSGSFSHLIEWHGLQITWLGHATFQVTTPQGTSILIDPWLADNPSCPATHKQLAHVDLLLLTHGHADHSSDVLPVVKEHHPTVVAIAELVHYLSSQGVENLVDLNIGGSITLRDTTLTMTRAIHTSGVLMGDQMLYTGEPAGYVIQIEQGPVLYYAGDTDVFGDMELIRELYAPDIALLPIGDRYTMGPRAAARAACLLGVKQVIPMHYGTFPLLTGTPQALRDALRELNVSDIQVIEMVPGQTIQ
jgi:L-ascorbate metabolism protein UlaG (beta-lactamase superfamily)